MISEKKKTVWLVLLVCVLIGVLLEKYFGPDSLCFARSGALITIIGLLIGLYDVWHLPMGEVVAPELKDEMNQHIHESEQLRQLREQHANDQIRHLEISVQLLNKSISMIRNRLELANAAEKPKKQLVKFEIGIITTGTIIWAFGDWISYAVFQ